MDNGTLNGAPAAQNNTESAAVQPAVVPEAIIAASVVPPAESAQPQPVAEPAVNPVPDAVNAVMQSETPPSGLPAMVSTDTAATETPAAVVPEEIIVHSITDAPAAAEAAPAGAAAVEAAVAEIAAAQAAAAAAETSVTQTPAEDTPAEVTPAMETPSEAASESAAKDTEAPAAGGPKLSPAAKGFLGIAVLAAGILIALASLYLIATATKVKQPYSGTNWYDVYEAAKQDVPEIASFDDEIAGTQPGYAVFRYGNTQELYACGASACEDGKYYYMSDPTQNGELVRIEKADGHEKTVLSELPAENLNLAHGRIYFLNNYTAGEAEAGIYSIAVDGSDPELLMRGRAYNLRLVNDWLYYIGGSDGKLCRMNIYERHEYVLSEEDCNDLQIERNTIYYISHDASLSQNECSVICRMDVDGKNRRELSGRGNFRNLALDADNLYYTIYNEGFGFIPLRTEAEPVLDEKQKKEKEKEKEEETPLPNFVQLRGLYSAAVPADGEIWFIDRKDMRSLAVYTLETGELRHYATENVTGFYRMKEIMITRWLKDGVDPKVSTNRIDTGEMVELF